MVLLFNIIYIMRTTWGRCRGVRSTPGARPLGLSYIETSAMKRAAFPWISHLGTGRKSRRVRRPVTQHPQTTGRTPGWWERPLGTRGQNVRRETLSPPNLLRVSGAPATGRERGSRFTRRVSLPAPVMASTPDPRIVRLADGGGPYPSGATHLPWPHRSDLAPLAGQWATGLGAHHLEDHRRRTVCPDPGAVPGGGCMMTAARPVCTMRAH